MLPHQLNKLQMTQVIKAIPIIIQCPLLEKSWRTSKMLAWMKGAILKKREIPLTGKKLRAIMKQFLPLKTFIQTRTLSAALWSLDKILFLCSLLEQWWTTQGTTCFITLEAFWRERFSFHFTKLFRFNCSQVEKFSPRLREQIASLKEISKGII